MSSVSLENFAFADENSENPRMGGKAQFGARGPMQDRKPLESRQPCGQKPTTRIQPLRAVKQFQHLGLKVADIENGARPKIAVQNENRGFSIFEDKGSSNGGLSILEDKPPSTKGGFAIFEHKALSLTEQLSKSGLSDHELELHPTVTALRPQFYVGEVDTGSEGLTEIGMIGEQSSHQVMKPPIASPLLSRGGSPMVLDSSSLTIDDDSEDDVNLVPDEEYLWFPEYRKDIYDYLRDIEVRHRVKADYMKKQPDITFSMRSILVDWLVEVAVEYKLERETLCLAVNYVDRFLTRMSVVRGKLQLLGAAAMFIACKYEEIYPPDMKEFVYITDNTYTIAQVKHMERLILNSLAFNMSIATVNWFCNELLAEICAVDIVSSLTYYLLELTLVDGERFLRHLPSVIATSCVCLANHVLGYTGLMSSVTDSTGYAFNDLKDCVTDLFEMFCNVTTHPQQAVTIKYKDTKFHEVSLLNPKTMTPSQTVPTAFY